MVLISACSPQPSPTLPAPFARSVEFTPSPSLTPSPLPTLTPTPIELFTLTPSPFPSPTPDIFAQYSIDALANRTYGGGLLQTEGVIETTQGYDRYLIRYRSEGYDMHGFMDFPRGAGPFPVIIFAHGWVDRNLYTTIAYTSRYTGALASAGFIAIHPDLRGYAKSPDVPNLLGIGDAIDILNLIALVRSQAGVPGPLLRADPQNIGLWGHSMGGAVVLRALIADPDIKAAVLYASINADESVNLEHFTGEDGRGNVPPSIPPDAVAKLSPASAIEKIKTPLSIHHGKDDLVVPDIWSRNLCERLSQLNIPAECFFYPDQAHTFKNNGDSLFIQRVKDFFTQHLK